MEVWARNQMLKYSNHALFNLVHRAKFAFHSEPFHAIISCLITQRIFQILESENSKHPLEAYIKEKTAKITSRT